MKREILFRGKQLSNGEFIEGSLTVDCHVYCYICHPLNVPIVGGFQNFFIDPETVGQYTGITDKHGIEIFEDDIVKYFEPHSKTWHTRIVRWDWRFAGFGLFDKESEWCKESDWLKIKDIEVIGNIHDNKEPLP